MKKISDFIKRCYNWFIVPKVGKRYNFFDDGKIYPNRHYIAECIKVIKFNEAKDNIRIHTESSIDEEGWIETHTDVYFNDELLVSTKRVG